MGPMALELAAHHQRFHGPHLDYAGVGVGAFLSWVGVSGPGEAALIAAGLLAARGRLDLAGVLAAGWAGAMLGGTAGWLLGLRGGRRLLTGRGPLRSLRVRMLRSGDRFYERFGVLAVYFAPSWMAGVNGLPARRFIPINAGCCAVWVGLVGGGAYLVGPRIADLIEGLGLAGLGILAVGAVILALVGGWRRRRRRR